MGPGEAGDLGGVAVGWTWVSSDAYQQALILSSIDSDLRAVWSVLVVILLIGAGLLLVALLREAH